ncbi:hypothetical protein ALQ04_01189 [Pseudomonas cichorii]|uniref:Lipoprotein n=1 Tax=Pseudomonas cichorii TaxID=36746 RepID=A0A3M4LPL1_PSECI|nr:hypothetical protein [Pseudomonas cichorii]RMQ43330.1 hypothetical protein ALQ04_01189 [Pseudomonas cichorii]
MRKTVMIMAVLALAGCDAGSSRPPAREKAEPVVQAPQVSTPQWFIQMNSREAVSDISAWLLERGYAPVVTNIDGKQQLLIGPFASPELAEEQRTGLLAKVAKSHRLAAPVVIERNQ